MIRAEAAIEIERSPREVLEFVLDLDRYRLADGKITEVHEQPTLAGRRRGGGPGTAGGFVCEPLGDAATRLTHDEQFDFRAPARWILDPFLGGWMQRYLVEVELPTLKRLIERVA